MVDIFGIKFTPITVSIFSDSLKEIYISLLDLRKGLQGISLFYVSVSFALKDLDMAILRVQGANLKERYLFRVSISRYLVSLSILFKETYHEYRRPR